MFDYLGNFGRMQARSQGQFWWRWTCYKSSC